MEKKNCLAVFFVFSVIHFFLFSSVLFFVQVSLLTAGAERKRARERETGVISRKANLRLCMCINDTSMEYCPYYIHIDDDVAVAFNILRSIPILLHTLASIHKDEFSWYT